MDLRYASVCDGIGAVHVAWSALGWRCAWTSEIEPFPIAVVEQRWGYRNLGDMTDITEGELNECGPINVLVGGTPCQSFSVAGLRGGLADARGNLALRFMQLVGATRPRWVVWENVPGVLSSDGGRDFGAILGALAELGYGFAYRVLDAQYFGLAQRRKRVFVVGCSGGWQRAAAVLFERHCLSGNPAPRRETGARAAARRARSIGAGVAERVCFDPTQITSRHNRSNPRQGDPCHTLTSGGHPPVVAFNWQSGGSRARVGGRHPYADALHSSQVPAVIQNASARRITPTESERLQGFPDGYTAIIYRGKIAADQPRYKGIHNSMAVPVMRWIGERIESVEAITQQKGD